MKKLFCLIFLFLLLFALALPCLAESVQSEANTEEDAGITLGERITEFWNDYTSEILSGGGILATLGLFFALWKKIKPLLSEILVKIVSVINAGTDSANIQDKHSQALNGLMDGLEMLDNKIALFEKTVDAVKEKHIQTDEHFKEIQKSLSDIARLLDAVYSNSKALPQGVKDMVHLYSADCVRIAEHEIYGDTEGKNNVEQS